LPIYTKAPPPVIPVWTWTGFYVGGNAGYSFGRASTDYNESFTSTSVVTATTTGGIPVAGNGLTATTAGTALGNAAADMNDWLAGVQAGYNWQVQQWVFGIEADIQGTGQTDDPLFCGTPGCPAGSLYGTSASKLPWFGTLHGRVGYSWNIAPNQPVMLYATGGLAYGEVDETYMEGCRRRSVVHAELPLDASRLDRGCRRRGTHRPDQLDDEARISLHGSRQR
jgi:outer membrane immunogenic protein